ncbi:MAG: POTRA domain-containing protein [Weeksellaceae bacterium]|nr:POTRA domain-containing protein [Weeksellaceae bacterium]
MKKLVNLLYLFAVVVSAQVERSLQPTMPADTITFAVPDVDLNLESLQRTDTIALDTIALDTQDGPLQEYRLGKLEISGGTPFNTNQILRFTGLQIGEIMEIPGSKLNNAVKKIWRTGQFSDVEVFATRTQGNEITLRFHLVGLTKIKDVTIHGVKKGRRDEFIKTNKLDAGASITNNLINQTRNNIKRYYVEKGYPDATVDFRTVPDTTARQSDHVHIHIDRGPRVKINSITFTGNEEVSSARLRRKGFKDTKTKSILRLFKPSKLIPEKYEQDKKNLLDLYRQYGFRDAKILSDNITRVDEKNYAIDVAVSEGGRYYLGDVTFTGNSVYSTEVLQRIFGFKKGDPYDAVGINKRVSGSEKDDDIATLYHDNGYLFSNVRAVERNVVNDTIDLEIRIMEGEQATWDRVTFNGNHQTHDHVIARELMTRPGELFRKSDIKRTYFKLGALGFFDAQQITQDINPNPETNTVDIDWKLAPKSSSQIELQGGYGGGRFIGTLGLTFQNFSIGNLFKGKAWKPVPLGDGQQLSLRAQAGTFFSNYSFTFTEPWIGGSRPTALSLSVYNSNFRNLFSAEESNLSILGASVGLNKLLTFPDDFFRLSQTVSYQRYNFNNYPLSIASLQFENGASNNVAYQIGLSRLSAGPDPIFPQSGSDFNISLKVTPPYSLFNNKDYNALREANNLQDMYKWLEFYKIMFSGNWYQEIVGKLVLRTGAQFGLLGAYNQDTGISPFERFFLGGIGLQAQNFDGREIIPLRGYQDFTNGGGRVGHDITPIGGGTIYNKFLLELRYPITMGQQAKIFGVGFLEAGNTWSEHKDFKPFELRRSAGVGVRVFMSAFGMLGFDFGYGFDSPIGAPGNPSGWQTHFIFGQNL